MVLKRVLCPILSALCIILLVACQAVLPRLRPPLEDEGEVYLYLQPFPQEAERLKVTIEDIFAVSGDGREIPLSVKLKELKPTETVRQRLLAAGDLPPGRYVGLSFKIKKAILKAEDGEADLLVPETPVKQEFPFNVGRKRAYVFSLVFKYRESITAGFSFSPIFSISIPAKPMITLTGFVANTDSNNITVFDKKLGQVVGVIATGRGPAGMALDQRLKRVYLAISGDDEIGLIDIMTGEMTNKIKLSTGDRPLELALTPDGRTLVALNAGSNSVSFVDPLSLAELKRVNVGNGPRSILIDPSGRRAYVFNTLSSSISVLDIANRSIVTTFSTDSGPIRGQFNQKGDTLYVIHELSSYLTVIEPLSFRVLRRFSVGTGMNSIKVDERSGLVYLGRKNDTVIRIYDPLSFVSVDFVKTGGTINYLAIDREENNLYMVSAEMKSLMVSNLVRKRIVYEMDVGEGPYWVTVTGER